MRRLAMIFLVIATTLGTAVPALAQGSGKVWRLGVLTLPTSTTSPVFETCDGSGCLDSFRGGIS